MLERTLLEVVDLSSEALKDAFGYKTLGPGVPPGFICLSLSCLSVEEKECMQGVAVPLGSPESVSLSTLQHFSSCACNSAFTFCCH